jgi:TP901 family phage tail tape measure protein
VAGFNVGDALVKLTLGDTKQFENDVAKAAGKAGDKAGTTTGKSLAEKIRVGFGAVSGGFLVAATEQASKFEDQLRTIQTVAPNLNLDKAKNDILALSRETGKSTDDLTAGFYDLVSAGVSADDAIGVLSDSAHFATGALGSTAEAVDLVTSVMNSYGLAAKDSARITDVFAKAVADGKVTAAELGGAISDIAPIASSAGIKIEEVSAGFAFLTKNGVPAAQAATQMRAAISALITPNTQLNAIQKETGINFAELAKTQGLAASLEALRKATHGNADAFAQALGRVDAYQFALLTTGEHAQAFGQEIIDVSHSQGLAMDQYSIKSQSAIEQGKRLVATVQSFIISVGAPFVNSIGPAIFALNQLGQAFGFPNILAKVFGATLGGLAGKLAGTLGPVLKNSIGVALSSAQESAALGFQNLLTFAVKRIQIPAQYLIQSLGFAFEDAFSYLGATSAGKFVTKFLGARALLTLATTAAAIIGPIAIAVALTFAAQGLQDQNAKDLSDNLANALKDGTDEAVAAAEKHLADLEHGARASHNDSWLNIILGQKADFDKAVEERNRGLEAQANATARNLDGVAATVGQTNGLNYATALLKGIGGGLAEGTKAFSPAIALLKGLGSLGGKELQKLAHEQGLRTAQALAQGYQDGKDAVKTQWSSFLDILKNSESPTKERARLLGELTSKALIKGLHDHDPYVKATAETTKQVILDRLATLKTNAHNIGKDGMEFLRRGMKSKDADIKTASKAIYNAATNSTKHLPAAGTTEGSGLAKNVASGIATNIWRGALAAYNLVSEILKFTNQLPGPDVHVSSPHIPRAAHGAKARAGEPFIVGDAGKPELFVPNVPGVIVPEVPKYRTLGAPDVTGGAVVNTSVSIGAINLHGIGSDVSPDRAKRFGHMIADEMGKTFRQQGARIGLHPNVVP